MILKTFCSSVPHVLSIICNGRYFGLVFVIIWSKHSVFFTGLLVMRHQAIILGLYKTFLCNL